MRRRLAGPAGRRTSCTFDARHAGHVRLARRASRVGARRSAKRPPQCGKTRDSACAGDAQSARSASGPQGARSDRGRCRKGLLASGSASAGDSRPWACRDRSDSSRVPLSCRSALAWARLSRQLSRPPGRPMSPTFRDFTEPFGRSRRRRSPTRVRTAPTRRAGAQRRSPVCRAWTGECPSGRRVRRPWTTKGAPARCRECTAGRPTPPRRHERRARPRRRAVSRGREGLLAEVAGTAGSAWIGKRTRQRQVEDRGSRESPGTARRRAARRPECE